MTQRLDANGNAPEIGTAGVGFRVVPGRVVNNVANPGDPLTPGGPHPAVPGAYPITVEVDGGSNRLLMQSGVGVYLDKPFQQLRLTGGEQSDVWTVQVFESRAEGVIPPAMRSTVLVPLRSYALNTAPASFAQDGWKIRPGMKSLTFYCYNTIGGALTQATIWVRQSYGAPTTGVGGPWYNTGDVLDFVSNGPVQTRQIITSGDRIYLQANSSNIVVDVDAEFEVE